MMDNQYNYYRPDSDENRGADNQQQRKDPEDRQTGFDPAFVQSHPACTPNRILGSSTW